MKLFVYGTLQRSSISVRNHVLREMGCTYERDAEVQGLVLYHLGSFPAAVRGTGKVIGEVWSLPADEAQAAAVIARLDAIEGHPYVYKREEVDGGLTTYLYQYPVDSRLRMEGRWVRGTYD